jgi:hypothetical protein
VRAPPPVLRAADPCRGRSAHVCPPWAPGSWRSTLCVPLTLRGGGVCGGKTDHADHADAPIGGIPSGTYRTGDGRLVDRCVITRLSTRTRKHVADSASRERGVSKETRIRAFSGPGCSILEAARQTGAGPGAHGRCAFQNGHAGHVQCCRERAAMRDGASRYAGPRRG